MPIFLSQNVHIVCCFTFSIVRMNVIGRVIENNEVLFELFSLKNQNSFKNKHMNS